MSYIPRLQTQYAEEIVPNLKERFEYKSVMQVPSITKICLNQGLGKAIADKKVVEYATDEMSRIVGQKAVKTISTKDVSNFKLRKGMPIGSRVTLRRDRMFDFLDRLIAVSLPRTRDFQGVSAKGFDGRGNFTLASRSR
jgi:large subunit ribosomal protein L5